MNEDVQELNDFLKGLYMGVHAYEYYIQNCEDSSVKKTLQDIQKEHKLSTIQVAERIQNLGGRPAKDEGAFASFIGKIHEVTAPTRTDEIILDALKNEEKYAVHVAGDNIKGDISEQQKQLIDQIFERNTRHIETLQQLLH